MVANLPWSRFIDTRLLKYPENPGDQTLRESVDVNLLPTPLEVFARTVTRDVLDSQSPAPADALRSEFLAYTVEKYSISWAGYGKAGDPTRSLRQRLVGRWHRFNINQFDRSPGERRCTPILAAIRGEPPGSNYNVQAFLDKIQEYANTLVASQQISATGSRYASDTFRPANYMNGGFKRQAQRSMASRVLFCTDDGLLLGLGPAEMQAGDELWVLSGAKTPSVLRPTATGRYRFLGEAFVYGLMHGQALALFPERWDIVLE